MMSTSQTTTDSTYQHQNISQATTLAEPPSRQPSVLDSLATTTTLTSQNQDSAEEPLASQHPAEELGTGNEGIIDSIIASLGDDLPAERVEEEPAPREWLIDPIIASFDRIDRANDDQGDPEVRDGIIDSIIASFEHFSTK